jgi:pyridoxamine 5'-phosphate oxidase
MSEHDLGSDDPLRIFQDWMKQAEASEPNDPNAAALATATAEGHPSVRMVLVKQVDATGFCFFTNAESRKGEELLANPWAALCFHWKSLRRQIRVVGPVSRMEAAEVDTYFHSRSRNSQIGAAVSQQSRPLSSRETLETQVQEFAAGHPEEIPRPLYWQGFRIQAEQIEFWMDGAHRLHDRFMFTRSSGAWMCTRLYP